MRQLNRFLIPFLLVTALITTLPPSSYAQITAQMQNLAVANGNGTVLSTNNMSTVTFTVICASCGGGTTINFEGTADGTNYVAMLGSLSGATTTATTTTSSTTQVWSFSVSSFLFVRARISAYSAGTISVLGRATPQGGGGGGGGGAAGAVTGTVGIDQSTLHANEVVCITGCSGGTSDTDDASIATGQSTGLSLGLTQFYDGSVWRRATVSAAGSGLATGLLTIQGHASGTPIPTNPASVTAPVSSMNSTSAAAGVNAASACNYDDSATTTLTENNFGFWRCSTNRNGYVQLRDAAGNERGANIDSSNRLSTSFISGAVLSGAYAAGAISSGAVASGAYVAGAISDGADVTLGAKADAKSTATDTTAVTLMQVSKQISASVQAIAALAATDPCAGVLTTGVDLHLASTTVTRLITASSAKKNYICSMDIVVGGTAEIISLVEGTGANCTSPAVLWGSATAASGFPFGANGGIARSKTIAGKTSNIDTCVQSSGSNAFTIHIEYVQQ